MKKIAFALLSILILNACNAQQMRPEDTEQWKPKPPVVKPGMVNSAPSDAIILFDGKNLNEWVSVKDPSKPAEWLLHDGVMTVNKKFGNIQTKKSFGSYQLHLEWLTPKNITGAGQGRGNSGVFLATTGGGDEGYELQIVDSYNNETYVNGQAGSIYKQNAPLANPMNPPGVWNVYDIIWTAPVFNTDGSLKSPARVTAFLNGVLIQNNYELKGPTQYTGHPSYSKAHGPTPIRLQSHGDPSEPLSFKNIWIRPL